MIILVTDVEAVNVTDLCLECDVVCLWSQLPLLPVQTLLPETKRNNQNVLMLLKQIR